MLDSYDLRMLNVGFHSNGSDWMWENVCSPFARIYLVVKGQAEVQFEKFTLKLSEGYLYLIPPFMRHSYIGNEGFAHYYLHLYEYAGASAMLFDDVSFSMEHPATKADYSIFEMLHSVFPDTELAVANPKKYDNDTELNRFCANFINRPPHERLLLKGAMLVLISRFILQSSDTESVNQSNLSDVRSYISSHLSDNLSIAVLADKACLSVSHFIRRFKAVYGMPPKQFIIRRRIERAELLLLMRNSSVKNIATAVGFDDVSLFVNTFKKATGMTPTEYRRRNSIEN